MRELGIPTVLDRFIQQAMLQVLQPILDPTFSQNSYGFRPGKSAHQALVAARNLVEGGKRFVVDVDGWAGRPPWRNSSTGSITTC